MHFRRALFLIAALVALPTLGAAQQAPAQQAPPTWESMVARVWKGTHDKILAMAGDLPAEKLSARPHPDSRTALDEFRHVTIGLEMSTAQLKGERFDYAARVKADAGKPATRESVVGEMEAAYKASMAAVETTPKPSLVFWAEHQGEHYGKLVTIYRMNNLVPPASRPRTR